MAAGSLRPWDNLQSGSDLKARRSLGICSSWLRHDQFHRQQPERLPSKDAFPLRWLLSLHRGGLVESSTITNMTFQQLKQPSALQPPRHTSTASSSFAKSFGPSRHAPTERPPTRTGRPVHARSKSQAPRPRTAHGHRLEEPVDAPDDNGTTRSSSSSDTSHSHPLHVKKLKSQHSAPLLPTIRTSSLINQFKNMSLNEQGLQKNGLLVNAQFSQSTSQLSRFPITSLHKIEERGQTIASSDTASATQFEVPGGT